MAPKAGTITASAWERVKRDCIAFERSRGGRPRGGSGATRDDYMPPIRGVLLEDLVDGGRADCAVMTLDETTWIQTVTIIGDVTGGTFALAFSPGLSPGPATVNLPWNCTPAAMQTALENLSTIGKGNVVVRLGKQTYHNDDAGTNPIASPGVWLVELVGTFAQSTKAPPLLTVAANALGSPGPPFTSGTGLNAAVVIDSTKHWVDTGGVETVIANIPVGKPTPMRTGAVVAVIFFPGIGYGFSGCECREFSQTYY